MPVRCNTIALAMAALLGGLLLGTPARANPPAESFEFTGAFQSYTVPTSGIYDLTGYGAEGGSSYSAFAGGTGAEASGAFALTAGEVINIAVGGAGATGFYGAGGGGGSFVLGPGGEVLLVAGGGGGVGGAGNGDPGSAGPDGTTPYAGGAGGSNGSGGVAWDGGGGGGVNGNGSGIGYGGDGQALPTLTGGVGYVDGDGGFGGGGGSGMISGGGGGGYSGGGGGYKYGGGGGGGSFLDPSAVDPTLVPNTNAGDGEVLIALQQDTPVPEPASFALFGSALGLLTVTLLRRRPRYV